jgi:hypothetical protein
MEIYVFIQALLLLVFLQELSTASNILLTQPV